MIEHPQKFGSYIILLPTKYPDPDLIIDMMALNFTISSSLLDCFAEIERDLRIKLKKKVNPTSFDLFF
ncbi:hypothetical protein BpHYR1_047138 [Brachionus plicatilis]|uniref:Uncharacterized protein n=1 Tax=Brachionus plicatilis TaxID=10195 RepID=A0A3M7R120_BRAPC|nr:hypothetical protein BpHYR1_047138 [Brachionus plicatilis]